MRGRKERGKDGRGEEEGREGVSPLH